MHLDEKLHKLCIYVCYICKVSCLMTWKKCIGNVNQEPTPTTPKTWSKKTKHEVQDSKLFRFHSLEVSSVIEQLTLKRFENSHTVN